MPADGNLDARAMHIPKPSTPWPLDTLAPPCAMPFSLKNRPIWEPPQHVPATRVAIEKNRVCHLMSPSTCSLAATHSEPRPSGRGHLSNAITQAQPQMPRTLRAAAFAFTLDALAPRRLGPVRTSSFRSQSPSPVHFDVSTFRFFNFSTTCPNTCPTQDLPASARTNCHRMSPSVLLRRRYPFSPAASINDARASEPYNRERVRHPQGVALQYFAMATPQKLVLAALGPKVARVR